MLTKKIDSFFGKKIDKRFIEYIDVLFYCISEAIFRVCFQDEIINKINTLTDREIQVINWAIKGKTSWEIAKIMKVSERTVKYHFSKIYNKLNVTNRQQAIAIAVHFKIF